MIEQLAAGSLIELSATVTVARTRTVKGKLIDVKEQIFDKTSERIESLVYNTWLCKYTRCHYMTMEPNSPN